MMEQGIQTNFPNADLKAAGCHYFVLMKYLEVKHEKNFSTNDLIKWFESALSAGVMGYAPNDSAREVGDNCNVLNAVGLLNMVLNADVYKNYRKNINGRPDVDICVRRLTKQGFTHFILDVYGATFDPLDPLRSAASTYKTDSYRVLI